MSTYVELRRKLTELETVVEMLRVSNADPTRIRQLNHEIDETRKDMYYTLDMEVNG